MITKEVLDAVVKGCAVEFEDALGHWQLRCLVDGEWCMPVDGKGWAPCKTKPNLAILLGILSKYEWRRHCEQRDWKGALEWLKEGKSIRRSFWIPGLILKLDACGHLQFSDRPHGQSVEAVARRFSVESFEAIDWELV